MLVYAILTDSELFCDVAVCETSHHGLKDFGLPGGQNGNRRILREKPFYVGRDYGFAAGNRADRGYERGVVGGFHERTGGAGFYGVGDTVR